MTKLLKTFFTSLAIIFFTGAIGLLTICDLFFDGFKVAIGNAGWLGILALSLGCMVISVIWTVFRHRRFFSNLGDNIDSNANGEEQKPQFFDALTVDLNKMRERKEYSDIIRVGRSLSRALWIAGEYENRITIGKLVYEAACSNQDNMARATTLIDDIGWTYSLLCNNTTAKNNIDLGIKYAEKEEENFWKNYWIAKGYRHLFNIELLEGRSERNIKNAQDYLKLAEQTAVQIENNESKQEMINGIDYDKIELLIFEEKYIEAKTKAEDILEQYKKRNDSERVAKLYSLLGKLSYIQRDYFSATGYFLDGLAIAERSSRTDEKIKNNMGLAVSKYMEGDIERYNHYRNECEKYLAKRRIRLIFWDVILEKYNSIN